MPLVVQRMIIEELGFDERLFLSFTSKRSCSLLGLFRNDVKGISIEIDIRTWDVSIRVRIPSYHLTERIFAINIRSLISNELKVDIPYKAYYMIGYSDYKIDGSTVQAVKYPSTIRIVLIENRVVRETNSNLVIVFGKLLRHLNSVLNIQECHQCEFFAKFPVGLFCQLDCSYSYGSIETRTGHIASTTPEDLTFLLDNIKAEQLSLNVAVPSDPGYKYQNNPEKKSSIDLLKILNYTWVNLSDLPAARVISMEIRSCEVNEVLKFWIAGRNRALEIGDFYIDRLTDLNSEAIFNGITRHETQLTESERDKFLESVYPSLQLLHNIITVDILRKSDGMRATVIEGNSNNEANRNVFVMVWSEKNLQTIGRAND
ncbi:hypothetical protein B9Z55_003291 [Caenorhabditis nigoni]|nr:hypothetical protein B9Z55_003291 [Caenorhabditis nigoni]